jgi:protein-S-isoprenylcysteine O-methyltransferase Ste14
MVVIYFLLPSTRIIHFPFNLLGAVICLLGIYISISTRNSFQKMNIPMYPSAKPNKLHTKGVFRYTRNPMYLGFAIGFTGLAILTSSFVNFILPVIFIIIMDKGYVRFEEKVLEREFGEDYIEYKNRVRRWI